MSEFAVDSTTQFIIYVALAVLAIIIGAIVAIIIYLKQRSRKSLSYKVLTVTQLLSIKDELKDKLKILYESRRVEDVSLVLIEIFNSGNTPIDEEDYKMPVTIDFGKEAQILTAEVTKVEPPDLQISTTTAGNTITIAPTLFNSGDSITIKSLVTKFSSITVSGRIAGVKQIEESVPKPNFPFYLLITFYFIGLVGILISSLFNQTLIGQVFALIFIIVLVVMTLYVASKFINILYKKLTSKSLKLS